MVDGQNLSVKELSRKIAKLEKQCNKAYEKVWPNGQHPRNEEAYQEWSKLIDELREAKDQLFQLELRDGASELDLKFLDTYRVATEEIDKKLDEAYTALEEACELAQEHGIPFRSSVVFNGDVFWPNMEKWSGVSDEIKEMLFEHDEIYREYGGEGWSKSYC